MGMNLAGRRRMHGMGLYLPAPNVGQQNMGKYLPRQAMSAIKPKQRQRGSLSYGF
jgi:hypothetical protein